MQVDESLRQAVMQLQSQQIEASRQLSTIRTQLNQKEREQKLNTLTLREIESLPRDSSQVGCYRAVGRMFMQESRNNVENTLKQKTKHSQEDVGILEKKAKYLENEVNTAQTSLRDILQQAALNR
ncbi:prefolding complex chaperone subunit [Sporobolomyces salmoneus]|uniref:prefolding complex chaperone subunit n=1 Tax=Sporobolomyces salmoneus TaxID=183962 RepID=UPI00317C398B